MKFGEKSRFFTQKGTTALIQLPQKGEEGTAKDDQHRHESPKVD